MSKASENMLFPSMQEVYAHPLHRKSINGVELDFAVFGDPNGPLSILLHGFPDMWFGWKYQIPALVAAGYRVLVPNQRGYGRSSKPDSMSAYDLNVLAGDIVALAESEGYQQFDVIGHDWGGIIGWWVAATAPDRLNRLVVINAPHPGVFWNYLWRHPSQAVRSLYIGLIQIPWLPEAILAANDFQLLRWAVRVTCSSRDPDHERLNNLARCWAEPGALTAMLNYYRALARRGRKSLQLHVEVPTLILFSTDDPVLEAGLAAASMTMCSDRTFISLKHQSHWIQWEAHREVNEQLARFLWT